jgi:hypothetical protein
MADARLKPHSNINTARSEPSQEKVKKIQAHYISLTSPLNVEKVIVAKPIAGFNGEIDQPPVKAPRP